MGKRKRALSKSKTKSTPDSKRRKRNNDNSPAIIDKNVKLSNADMLVGTSKNAVKLAHNLVQIFSKNKNNREAPLMKKYVSGKFDFFGLKAPIRKTLAKECMNTKLSSPGEIRDLASILWSEPERELQYFVVDYLIKHFKYFGDEKAEFEPNVNFVKHLLTTKSWWDTVDALSSNILGRLVQTHPLMGKPVLEDWINDDNMWLRRAAILHQIKYKEKTDEEMLFRFCCARAQEQEFFIQKAIGWALRSYAWTNGAAVKKFLLKNKQNFSKLSYQEAAKHLSGM